MDNNKISVYNTSFLSIFIRFCTVALIGVTLFYLIKLQSDLTVKSYLAIFTVTIFLFIPRIFYYRYKRVIVNEELKIKYSPKGFWERFIFATRNTLASPFVVILTGIMIYYSLITLSKPGLIIIASSFMLYIAFELTLNTVFFSNYFNQAKFPAVYPFYRRWISIILTSLICTIVGSLIFEPTYTKEEAFKILTSAVTTNNDSVFPIFLQSLNITVGIADYLLGLTVNTPWYPFTKFLLITLPYTVLSVHFTLAISLITLSPYRIKQTLSKQKWVKTKGNFILRNWKTICLPVFLISLFYAAYHYGTPLYQKYVMVINNKQKTTQIVANSEIIGDKYYKTGSVQKINDAKLRTRAQISSLLNEAVNETKLAENELTEYAQTFAKWYLNRHTKDPFTPQEKMLKQAILGMINVKDQQTRFTSLSRDIENNVNNILLDLSLYIEDTLEKNYLADYSEDTSTKKQDNRQPASKYIANIKLDASQIMQLELDNGYTHALNKSFVMPLNLPDLEEMLMQDISDPTAIWFKPAIMDNTILAENELLAELNDNSEESAASDKAIEEQDKNLLTEQDLYNYLCAILKAWENETINFFVTNLHTELETKQDKPKNRVTTIQANEQ